MPTLAPPATVAFDTTSIAELLAVDLDRLPFGVVMMDGAGTVLAYNAAESRAAGVPADRVIGKVFFRDVGPCMNNGMVAGAFDAGGALDQTLDYVLTLRMSMTPVRLRLLADPERGRRALLVDWS